ncbi:MAG: YcjX family protein [Rhizobiaceae bacterium]|nr:YcjX family protein [Rhizobiaceae bacterium]
MSALTTLSDEARISLDTLGARAGALLDPSLRLGVTGLSRAGKTVFITAFLHALLSGARLPLFSAQRDGRVKAAALAHQPDDTVPRFQYEEHLRRLVDERIWPESTRSISEVRITLRYESASGWGRLFNAGKFSIDLIDYPGEWLLDLPLLGKDFATFSTESLALGRDPQRAEFARPWLEATAAIRPDAPFNEEAAHALAAIFTAYLKAGKDDERALSTLPPGRFLMPGDLAGSPALTFAPLDMAQDSVAAPPGSFAQVFSRRYEAYKAKVVRPFFRDHVARLDRQIVLIDALQAINAGPQAVADLERALSDILACFRPGAPGLLAGLFLRRIDRILIAATKADHLHHEAHDRLTRIVRRIASNAERRAGLAAATVDVVALAAARATREGMMKVKGESLPVIIGTPERGERIGSQSFNGEQETAIFPGDLPDNPDSLFKPVESMSEQGEMIRFVRFRPPRLERKDGDIELTLPHIRLDKAIEFLIGDRLA